MFKSKQKTSKKILELLEKISEIKAELKELELISTRNKPTMNDIQANKG